MRSYRVARFDMRLQTDSLFVVFKDGWHDTESTDDGTGLEWQWSKREGSLSARNPKIYAQVRGVIEDRTANVMRI